jgi:tripartite-type tricarboxylate transporter receptor subunit TctC
MVYAPSSMPAVDVARLRDALQRALSRHDVAAKLTELGVESRAIAPGELAAFGTQEIQRWAEAVKRSGAQLD